MRPQSSPIASPPKQTIVGAVFAFGGFILFFALTPLLWALIIFTANGTVPMTWIFCVAAGLVFLFIAHFYNQALRLRNAVQSAKSQLDNDYQRRSELLPNLVELVKDAMGYESDTLKNIVQLRQKTQDTSLGGTEKIKTEDQLSHSMLNVLAEAYPQLHATANIDSLKTQLAQTEDRIAEKRDAIARAIEVYNSYTASFPAVLVVRPLGFSTMPMPNIDNRPELRQTIKVDVRE
jgi:LemA protein